MASFTYDGSDSADPNFEGRGFGYSAYVGSTGEAAYYDYATLPGSPPDYVTVDDFEPPKDLSSNYQFNRGSSYAEAVTDESAAYSGVNELGPSYHGGGTLEHSGGNVEMFSLEGDGLPNYPKPGDTISCYVLSEGGAGDAYIAYGAKSLEDFYALNVDFSNGRITLFKQKGGSWDSLRGTPVSLQPDTWYYVTIHWGKDGTHELYLYDVDENVLGEFSATDAEFTSGGVGFLTYTSDSSEKFYYDHLIVGKSPSSTTGGWGSEHRYAYSQTATGTQDIDLVEDFNWYLDYGGWDTVNKNGTNVTYQWFSISSWFHTYKYNTSFTTSPSSSDMEASYLIDSNKFTVDVNNTGGGIDNYVSVQDSLTKTIALGHPEWVDWKDTKFGIGTTREIARQKAHDTNTFDKSNPPWFFDALYFLLGEVKGIGEVMTLLDFMNYFWRDEDCTYNEDDTPNTHHTSEWLFCEGKGLAGHISEFIVRVPEGEQVNASISQNVGSDRVTFNPPSTLTWSVTCPFSGNATLDGTNKS